MKNWKVYAGLGILAGSMLTAGSVCAEETAAEAEIQAEEETVVNPYEMISGEDYELDLNGDGITETVRYETAEAQIPTTVEEHGFEGEWTVADLSVYVNGELAGEIQEEEWSYLWDLWQCPLESGQPYLYAVSRGDNDWPVSARLLSMEDGEMTEVAELTEIARETETGDGKFLSGWARMNQITGVGENTIQVNCCDALLASGNTEFTMEFEITEEGVLQKDGPCSLDAEKEWTTLTDISVATEPGSTEEAFVAAKGEILHLTAITKADGVYYLQCENQNGDTGWIRNPEQMPVHEDGTYSYFAESIFAG